MNGAAGTKAGVDAAEAVLFTRAFGLVSLAHFLHALSFHLYLHFPGFLTKLGASEVVVGLLFGATAATAIAARPTIGRVMDTRGRRVVLIGGGALTTVVCTAYLAIGSLGPAVWLVRMAHGVGEAMLFASLFAYATDIVPASRRIEGIALFGVAGMLPLGLGGLVGDVLLERGGYALLFETSVAFSVVALALTLPLREVRREGTDRPRGLVFALFQPNLMPLWLVGTVFATALAAHFTFMKTFVVATGKGTVGTFFAAYSCAAIALRVLFGKVPERVGPKRVLLPAMASMAAGYGLLAATPSDVTIGVAGLLCGLGHGYVFPVLLGLVVARARDSERGAALAIFTALFDAGVLIGGPMMGAIIRASGYAVMFATASVLIVAGGATFALWDRHAKA